MRLGLILAVAALATFAPAQQMPDMKPPAEMKKVAWMLGTWKGPMTFHQPDGKVMKMEGRIKSVMSLGGRFLHGSHVMSGKDAPTTEGLLLINYDPAKKAFVAYWFDSTAPGMMEATGQMTGDTLTLTGSIDMPGAGKYSMRTTYTHKGDMCIFRLEMQQNGKWVESISGDFKKS